MANCSSPPGPFPANPCEVPYIVHLEEFINKGFLSRFRNASPSMAFEALLPVQRAAPGGGQGSAGQERGSSTSSCCSGEGGRT